MLDLCDYNNFTLFDHLSAMKSGVCSGNNEVASFIKHENSAWPNVVYNIATRDADESLFDSIGRLIEENHLQPLVFCDADSVEPNDFKAHKFLPIDRWTKMQLDLNSYVPRITDSAISCSSIKVIGPLHDWLDVVSQTLFSGKKLDLLLFSEMLALPEFKFHIGVVNDVPVTASLVFIDSNNVAGIYMVSTLSAHQGKGYARMLLDFVFADLLICGISKCVLQSTKAGLKLYTQMGFQSFGHLNLYWKLK